MHGAIELTKEGIKIMDYGLRGKTAGITGAAQKGGIGYAIAKRLLMEGADVFLCDINEEAVKDARRELSALGNVETYVTDVSDEKSVQEMFRKAEERFNRLDIFINNAGIYPQRRLMDMSAEQWDKVMGVNLRSVFLCSREAAGCMKQGGVLINAASFAAVIPSAGSGAYAASKAAVLSLTRTLAAELADRNIRVNAFIPGVIATEMTRPVIEKKGDALLGQIAIGRLGEPEDVAKAVAFLCSDEASYLTGTSIEVSGGKFCVQNPDFSRV